MKYLHMGSIAVISALLFGSVGVADAGNVNIADRNGALTRIVVSSDDQMMQRTGKWCRDFLKKRGFSADLISSGSMGAVNAPVWVLETVDSCPAAQKMGIDTSKLHKAKADAYILHILVREGVPVVSIIGRNPQGVRSGVARLVAIMKVDGESLTAPVTSEMHDPFFPIRRLMVAPTGRIAQYPEYNGLPVSFKAWADTRWENWSDERIRQYAEQLWLYGFNSLEFAEIRGYRMMFSDDQVKNEITPKIRVFMKAARDNGMQVSQFIWGQSLFKEGDNLCWNLPEERKKMESEYHRLAQTYGDLVDHIVVHVGDPGGCSRNGCDAYKTTQEIATFLHKEYKKVNPKVTATLSSWANFGFWEGNAGAEFLDNSFSPKEVGIALHRWYDPEKAAKVVESGRKLDIWGWYLSDFEMELDMDLFMQRLDKYYRSLPDNASKEVRALSTEICFHGWPSIINAYVTAQKMWDPNRSLDDIEREFCAATFGDANADAMVAIYKACEAYVHPDHYYGFIPPTDCLPAVFGTPKYNNQLRKALEYSRRMDLDSSQLTRFTASTDPEKLSAYLTNHLNLIAVFSEAQENINLAKTSGATDDELHKIVDDAVVKADPYKNDLDYNVLLRSVSNSITEK
ncbi:MAG: hypothetical protein ACYC27_20890 [Armatimonadota bacterium]